MCVCVCVCVSVHLCVFVCLSVCVQVSLCVCVCVFMFASVCTVFVYLYVYLLCICVYASVSLCVRSVCLLLFFKAWCECVITFSGKRYQHLVAVKCCSPTVSVGLSAHLPFWLAVSQSGVNSSPGLQRLLGQALRLAKGKLWEQLIIKHLSQCVLSVFVFVFLFIPFLFFLSHHLNVFNPFLSSPTAVLVFYFSLYMWMFVPSQSALHSH